MIARQKALNYTPGTEYSYTNSGYNLMAIIVERVSGQSLAAFSKARLFGPLGMSRTSWRDDFRRVVKDQKVPHCRDPQNLNRTPAANWRPITSYSTALVWVGVWKLLGAIGGSWSSRLRTLKNICIRLRPSSTTAYWIEAST